MRLTVGVPGEGGVEIQEATLCTRERAAAIVIAGWVRDAQDAVLIARLAESSGRDID